MRYAVIANPVAGRTTVHQKRSALAGPAQILDAEVYGLDTSTTEEFAECARKLAQRCDVLVIAGGDGTLSEIINALDTRQAPIAFLPLGSGNATRHALNYRGRLAQIGMRIKRAPFREYDLILCDEKRRAMTASVGFEGAVVQLRDQYMARGMLGFQAYLRAALNAYFRTHSRSDASVTIDGVTSIVSDLFTLLVFKQPYYGYGMKVVPGARFDDRRLHILSINSGLGGLILGGVTAFTIGNRIGIYRTGHQVSVGLDRPQALQIDGTLAWTSQTFHFTLLPKALRLKC
ncbi:MAG: NAD(+)/NADH kinase [Proteobacteria bacterium]|nr:NAD(+)/NADH kinase [Pseudomonadota bacterium]